MGPGLAADLAAVFAAAVVDCAGDVDLDGGVCRAVGVELAQSPAGLHAPVTDGDDGGVDDGGDTDLADVAGDGGIGGGDAAAEGAAEFAALAETAALAVDAAAEMAAAIAVAVDDVVAAATDEVPAHFDAAVPGGGAAAAAAAVGASLAAHFVVTGAVAVVDIAADFGVWSGGGDEQGYGSGREGMG